MCSPFRPIGRSSPDITPVDANGYTGAVIAPEDQEPGSRPKSKGKRTSTSSFGVSRREGHDASPFYSRFEVLAQDKGEGVSLCPDRDKNRIGDGRYMTLIPSNSIALVVTSPPYYAGKDYELADGTGDVPTSYKEYLEMLREVTAECYRVLEPGGRIAINVANLGRRPYRSLSADVWDILQEDSGYLPRGEILWIKAAGANGSCAWGSYASPANPVLRDVSERILIASKGRLDRAIKWRKRQKIGLPWRATIDPVDFRQWTLDTWHIPPASATRIGHPAPYPVELPHRLIQLYTWEHDTVLDPFMGSGTTAIAAARSDRHWLGYDTDPGYVANADLRIKADALSRR